MYVYIIYNYIYRSMMGLYQLDRGNRFLPFDCQTTLVKGTDISTQGLNSLKVKRASLHRLSVDLLLLFARSVVSQDLWTATHPTLHGYKNGNVRTQMHRWRKVKTAGKIPWSLAILFQFCILAVPAVLGLLKVVILRGVHLHRIF